MNGARRLPGKLLRKVLAWRGTIQTPLLRGSASDIALIAKTRQRTPLLMNDACALQLLIAVRATRKRQAAMAEAGVYMGGSARLICEAKGDDTHLHLFDLFDGPASPGAPPVEMAVRSHFGQVQGKRAHVERLLDSYSGVTVHQGLFPASAAAVTGERFSFVHFDLDLPESTQAALDFFHPRMIDGGVIIGDDYYDDALRRCYADFFDGRPDTRFDLPWGQVMIVTRSS